MDQPVNNKTALIVVAAVVILVGGVWYLASSSVGHAPVATASTGSSAPVSGTAPISSLLTLSGSHECSVTVSGSSHAGTVDVSNGQMSSTFLLSVNGKPTTAHILNDGTTIYAWSDTTAKGVELPVTPALQMTSLSYGGITLATPVTYTCTAWTPVADSFTPPTSITFTTVGQ